MNHIILDIIGHVGYAFILLGMFLISKKNHIGWIFRLSGEVMWLFIGIMTGFSSIWIWGIIFMCMDIYGFYSWRKNEK